MCAQEKKRVRMTGHEDGKDMKEKKDKKSAGGCAVKREPNERGPTDEQPNLIEEPVVNAPFVCKHAAHEGGRGREKEGGGKEREKERDRDRKKGRKERKKESKEERKERKEGKKDRQTDRQKESNKERTKERQKEGQKERRKKDREREKEQERKREKIKRNREKEKEKEKDNVEEKDEEKEKGKGTGVLSYETSVQGHTRERGAPECCMNTPKGKEGRAGRERGGKD